MDIYILLKIALSSYDVLLFIGSYFSLDEVNMIINGFTLVSSLLFRGLITFQNLAGKSGRHFLAFGVRIVCYGGWLHIFFFFLFVACCWSPKYLANHVPNKKNPSKKMNNCAILLWRCLWLVYPSARQLGSNLLDKNTQKYHVSSYCQKNNNKE